jgi:hypothetical protein
MVSGTISINYIPLEGFEPSRPKTIDFKSILATNYNTKELINIRTLIETSIRAALKGVHESSI